MTDRETDAGEAGEVVLPAAPPPRRRIVMVEEVVNGERRFVPDDLAAPPPQDESALELVAAVKELRHAISPIAMADIPVLVRARLDLALAHVIKAAAVPPPAPEPEKLRELIERLDRERFTVVQWRDEAELIFERREHLGAWVPWTAIEKLVRALIAAAGSLPPREDKNQ